MLSSADLEPVMGGTGASCEAARSAEATARAKVKANLSLERSASPLSPMRFVENISLPRQLAAVSRATAARKQACGE